MTVDSLLAALRAGLDGHADPVRAVQQQAYMKSALPYRGVTAPELRRVARPLIRASPLDRAEFEVAIRTLVDHPVAREDYYLALEIARHRVHASLQTPDLLPLYRHVVVATAWWDVVDATAGDLVGSIVARYPEQKALMRAWARDDDLWLRRTAILCQLGWRDATDTALLAEVIEANVEGTLFGSVFWIRKAIGWSLRQYARADPEWVRGFVSAHEGHLSGLSRREALKHVEARPSS